MASEAPEKDPRATYMVPVKPASWATASVKERVALPKQERGNGPLPGEFTEEQQQIIEELFEAALNGTIPRHRILKAQEVERLNERHLAMILMRASGYHQRVIAKAFGASDSAVHFVLNHPDAEYLLARILAMKVSQPSDIQKRLRDLSEHAMNSLEDFFTSDDPDTLKVARIRAPMAFKVFEAAGVAAPKKTEGKFDHVHRLDATPEQLGEISSALREARQIQDVEYTSVESPAEARRLLEAPEEAPVVPPTEGEAP